MGKPQRRVAGDSTLAVDDLGDPIGRDAELTRQFGRRHANGFKPLGENFTRLMDCCGHIAFQMDRLSSSLPMPH